MHDTAYITGDMFAELYGGKDKVVVDIGGLNVNGSLRKLFEERGMKYVCVDIEPHPSVDIVIKPTDKLPFETGSVDLVVSTSCFEHDPCFWITFKEMNRITKPDGYIYVNAPSNGAYHKHPGDNWRFYSDAGQALAYWSCRQLSNEDIYPVKVVETFHVLPISDTWIDFVCIWQRTNETQDSILVADNVAFNAGLLQRKLNEKGARTIAKI